MYGVHSGVGRLCDTALVCLSLFCRRLLIRLSSSCGVEEEKGTASAVSYTNDSTGSVGSESVPADLLQQVRRRDGATCPRCRSVLMVNNGSYGHFQRYLCKDCDRTFNDKSGTIFIHSKVGLRKWLFSIYAFLRFNTSVRQLQREMELTYKARLPSHCKNPSK